MSFHDDCLLGVIKEKVEKFGSPDLKLALRIMSSIAVPTK